MGLALDEATLGSLNGWEFVGFVSGWSQHAFGIDNFLLPDIHGD